MPQTTSHNDRLKGQEAEKWAPPVLRKMGYLWVNPVTNRDRRLFWDFRCEAGSNRSGLPDANVKCKWKKNGYWSPYRLFITDCAENNRPDYVLLLRPCNHGNKGGVDGALVSTAGLDWTPCIYDTRTEKHKTMYSSSEKRVNEKWVADAPDENIAAEECLTAEEFPL